MIERPVPVAVVGMLPRPGSGQRLDRGTPTRRRQRRRFVDLGAASTLRHPPGGELRLRRPRRLRALPRPAPNMISMAVRPGPVIHGSRETDVILVEVPKRPWITWESGAEGAPASALSTGCASPRPGRGRPYPAKTAVPARLLLGREGLGVSAVDTVELEVRGLVRRRGLDRVSDRTAVRQLVDEVVADYDERSLTSALPPLSDTRQAARGLPFTG